MVTTTDRYQEAVNEQLARFEEYSSGYYNHIAMGGAFYTEDALPDDVPLWTIPFANKEIMPLDENKFTYIIDDEDKLIELRIPRQYSAVLLEREIVVDQTGHEVLIERAFFKMTDRQGGTTKLVAGCTVSKIFYSHSNELADELRVDSSTPDMSGISFGWEIDGNDPRKYLKDQDPLTAPILTTED